MASEFYQKTAALYEEFEKRELHYLNMEKSSSNSVPWKNNSSLPLQDYLLKINKREKETEETYKTLLKQMEEMDRSTDLMALKLEKLDALKSSIMKSTSSWPAVDSMYSQNYDFRMQSTVMNSDLGFNSQTSKLNISTQTEAVYCEQCNSPISLHMLPSFHTTKSDLNSNSSQILESIKKSSFQDRTGNGNAVLASDNENILHRTSFAASETFTTELDFIKPAENVNDVPMPNTVGQKNSSTDEKLLQGSADYKENLVSGHGTDIYEGSAINERKCNTNNKELYTSIEGGTVSIKSDDESMNHEFDFLESGKTSANKTQIIAQDNFQTYEKEHQANDQHFVHKKSSASVMNAKEQKSSISLNPPTDSLSRESMKPETKIKNGKIDEITNSSISATGPPSPSLHSENLSVASDSDSMFEKDVPLTATAAYQAMLGNAVLTERTSKKQVASDSESEDEVENALANAVKKGGNLSIDPANQNENENKKESLPQAESKPSTKVSKSSAPNKPSKLSKNTRKVLGLDTSSGSEMELEVKPNANNNPEDSDEFDFYN